MSVNSDIPHLLSVIFKGEISNMANFMQGDTNTADYLVYGMPSANTLNYIQQEVQSLNHTFGEFGSNVYNRAMESFTLFNSDESMRLARAATRAVVNLWEEDTIRPLNSIGEFQWAGYQMQRWVMAAPDIRHLYHSGEVEGYSDTYVDFEPNKVGEDHYDYRRVMNGIVEVEENGDWHYTTYCEDLEDGDRELDLDEQADILMCWNNLRNLIEDKKDDPTSRWNAAL